MVTRRSPEDRMKIATGASIGLCLFGVYLHRQFGIWPVQVLGFVFLLECLLLLGLNKLEILPLDEILQGGVGIVVALVVMVLPFIVTIALGTASSGAREEGKNRFLAAFQESWPEYTSGRIVQNSRPFVGEVAPGNELDSGQVFRALSSVEGGVSWVDQTGMPCDRRLLGKVVVIEFLSSSSGTAENPSKTFEPSFTGFAFGEMRRLPADMLAASPTEVDTIVWFAVDGVEIRSRRFEFDEKGTARRPTKRVTRYQVVLIDKNEQRIMWQEIVTGESLTEFLSRLSR